MAFMHPPVTRTEELCSRPHELSREAAVIQLQDHWATFARAVVMSSATKRLQRASENRQRGPYITEVAALNALRATFTGKAKKSPYWEPTWFDPVQVIDAVNRLAVPNAGQLSAGFGITPNPFESLRATRNFFAHRTKRTASEVNRVVGLSGSEEIHIFLTQPVVGGATIFEQWVAQMMIMGRVVVD
jgi:hypothetical protein